MSVSKEATNMRFYENKHSDGKDARPKRGEKWMRRVGQCLFVDLWSTSTVAPAYARFELLRLQIVMAM